MYEAFFKFHSRPFAAAPQSKTYFPAAVIENARQALTRLIARGEGPGLIIGPPGTGKSLLCRLLADQFQDQFAVAVLACGRLKTNQALLQAILYELGLPFRGMDEGELRLSLMDYLEPRPEGRAGLLLLVDEAHALGWRLLDEIRMLTNLVRDGQPRVRVVLAGGPVLEERFASPKLSSFAQRLASRCYLEPLDSVETAEYVRAQIAAVGGDPRRLFDEGALRSVYRASDGVPRLINQVCDHALILASVGGQRRLSSEVIDEAWADLQQLPPPWTPGTSETGASEVVEFGKLDDDSGELPEAIPFRGAEPQQPSRTQPCGPEQQLDAIAEQLSTLENEEVPVTIGGTEEDLDFPDLGNPFAEEFEEEEVVVENYSSDVEIFAEVPRVSSWEGQQLGAMLDQIETQPWAMPQTKVRITEPSSEEATPPGPIAHSAIWAFSPASDPVLPEEPAAQPPAASQRPDIEITSREVSAVGTPTRSLDQLAGAANDRDVIVVEDDTLEVPLRPSPGTERKGEFRQLFAKLRRG